MFFRAMEETQSLELFPRMDIRLGLKEGIVIIPSNVKKVLQQQVHSGCCGKVLYFFLKNLKGAGGQGLMVMLKKWFHHVPFVK